MIYEIAGFRLDSSRRILFGADGQPIALKPKVLDTLIYFVEHAGEMLEKDALLAAVWGKVVVEENGLNQHVSTLRRVFGETPGENRFIVTIPGRGYRFVAPVHVRTPQELPPVVRRTGLRRFSAVAAALAAIAAIAAVLFVADLDRTVDARERRIAVLPLENLSPDPARAYVASGFHDAIISRLGALRFDVRPRGAVMAYAQMPRPPLAEIARALDVDVLIEGSARYADDRLRISLALVDASTGSALWTDTFDRRYADIFSIESEVAQNVADALAATLAPRELAAAEDGYSRDPEAYDFYLTGMDHERRGVWNSPTAITHYERAVAEDPAFALAWARLALARLTTRRWVSPDPALLDGARTAAQEAVRLAPEVPLGHVAAAYCAYLERSDPRAILVELDKVQSKAQRLPEFFWLRADLYEALGLWEQALADRSQVVALDPRNVPALLGNAHGFEVLRRYAEAEPLYRRAAELEPNDRGMLVHSAMLPLFRSGDVRALRALERRMLSGELPVAHAVIVGAMYERDYDAVFRLWSLIPDPPPGTGLEFARALNLGLAYRFSGNAEASREAFTAARDGIERLLAKIPGESAPGLELGLADALLGLDERDAAAERATGVLRHVDALLPEAAAEVRLGAAIVLARAGALDRAVAELDAYLSRPGVWSIEGLEPQRVLDGIRDDPRWVALVRKHRRAEATVANAIAAGAVGR